MSATACHTDNASICVLKRIIIICISISRDSVPQYEVSIIDFIVFGRTKEEYLANLAAVLDRLRKP